MVLWFVPSAPIPTRFTPLLAINCNAWFTLDTLWIRIFPFFSTGGSLSPEMTSNSLSSFSPSLKSCSMVSIRKAWPAFLKCELHHAVKVYEYISNLMIHNSLNARVTLSPIYKRYLVHFGSE